MMKTLTMHNFRSVARRPAILLAGLLIAGCGAANGTRPAARSAAPDADTTRESPPISIDNFTFSPATVTVAVGATVTWINHDDVPHTVTATDKQFTSKALDTDDRFSHAFTAPGTYAYYCAVHPHMTGQVVVR